MHLVSWGTLEPTWLRTLLKIVGRTLTHWELKTMDIHRYLQNYCTVDTSAMGEYHLIFSKGFYCPCGGFCGIFGFGNIQEILDRSLFQWGRCELDQMKGWWLLKNFLWGRGINSFYLIGGIQFWKKPPAIGPKLLHQKSRLYVQFPSAVCCCGVACVKFYVPTVVVITLFWSLKFHDRYSQ